MAHMPAYTGFPLNTPNTRRHFMTTPYDSFNEWFTRLPLKYRQDLASEIAALLPGMEVNPYHRKFLDDFSAQLDGIRKKGHREEYGLILCLKTLIDHIVNEKNQANSGWEKEKAVQAGLPGGLVLPNPVEDNSQDSDPTLKIAFDFDGVLADDESERQFQKEGLQGFQKFEQEKARTPHAPGPLRNLFQKLSAFQRLDYKLRGQYDPYFNPAIRISVVTARGAQSEERLITTLKSFGMNAAELFLLDGLSKAPILEAIRPHIFFDDQVRHLTAVEAQIPSVLVPFGIHNAKR